MIFISFDLFGFFHVFFFQFLPLPSAAGEAAFSASTGTMQCWGSDRYGGSVAAGGARKISEAAWKNHGDMGQM